MTVLSTSPRLIRGAIVGIDPMNPLASATIFQYNPNELTRSLTPQTTDDDEDRSEPMRLKGPPIEIISLNAEIDATDQLASGNGLAVSYGLYPQLSALEMLVYPKSLQVITNTALLAAGTLEIIPTTAPLTLFVWGVQRVLPVRIQDFSITEDAFDANLNPIRAQVSLSLRVLSYEDLSASDPAYSLFLTNQILKETMATLNNLNNAANLSNS